MSNRKTHANWLGNTTHAAPEQAEADRAARAARLTPELVTYWTDLIVRAAPLVQPGRVPCDYTPWVRTLRDASVRPPLSDESVAQADFHLDLMRIAEDVAAPGWPDPRRDLIEFALAFLEADVMLFRSGYTKRHFATRLRQSPLTDMDVQRIEAVLRRSVIHGAGLEEFRAFCKLAAKLVCGGQLGAFADWAEATAQGAVLTMDRADGAESAVMFQSSDQMSEADKLRLVKRRWFQPSPWGLPWPALDRIVPAGDFLRVPEAQMRRNSYLMVRAIQRRKISEPRD